MRHTVRAIALGLAATVVAALGLAAAAPADAKASPREADWHSIRFSPYVALGDSYSSGAGVTPLVPTAPPTCSRSLENYAHDIAAWTGARSFTDVSCSGAKTSDFFSSQAAGVAPQLAALGRSTRLVTMTIGGNDENVFSDSFFGCATVSLASGSIFGDPCRQKYGYAFDAQILTQTFPNLVHALSAVHRAAPRATVVILGYPTILPSVGSPACYPAMPISMGDVPYLHQEEELLNGVIRMAALVTGSRFVDMSRASQGHDACQPVGRRWIEPAVGPINAYPVHPNAAGEAAMARQTLARLDR